MRCPDCGHGNPDGAKFCAECGAKLPQACGQCGAAVMAGAKFCIECGAAVAAAAPAVQKPEAPPAGEPAAADERPDGAERRQLTVMFCDLADSTRLAAEHDPEELRELNRAYRKLCAETIQRYEGYIARYMGDGVLAYFGYPRAHEDDAARAVRAGLEIAAGAPALGDVLAGAETVAVRMGVATGPVVVGELIGEGAAQEHDVVGETPNLAARLQGLASPNGVVVSDETRKLLGAAFELDDMGEQPLKGFSEPVRAWRVIGAASVESRFEASQPGGLTPFIGREHEMALVLDCWRRAAGGEGQVVLLSGEPGIGKSRIISTTRDQLAGSEYVTVRLQCSPYHQNSSLYPVVEHVRRAAGLADDDGVDDTLDKLERLLLVSDAERADAVSILASLLAMPETDRYPTPDLDPEVLRERTLELLVGQLESLSRQQPLLILVEDVHWADPTTLALLGALVEEVRAWRALLMITFRPEFQAPWTGEAHVSFLSLNRLDRHQCEAMVERLTGGKALPSEIVDQIALKTDGVPLFVEELTRTIVESGLVREESGHYVLSGPMQPLAIPTTLQDSLMARLDQLDDAKSLAQTGAAIGREFSRDLLLTVSGQEGAGLDAALSRLVDSGLVFHRGTGSRARFVFKHALVQDAAYNSMLKSRRIALHGRIAEVLSRQFPDVARTQPELLAHHYSAAGLDAHALPHWQEAGRQAMERSAHEEAIAHFRRGLESVARLDMDRQAATAAVQLLISRAECLRIGDRLDEAFESLQEAEDLADRFELPAYLARIHHQRGNLYFPMARTDECLAEHQQALEYARAAGSVEEEVRALGGLGDGYYVFGRMRTAKGYFEKCVALAREHGFTKTAAANMSMRGYSRAFLLELKEALQDGREACQLGREAGHPRAEMLGHIMQYSCHYFMANYQQALEEVEKAQEATQRLGARRFEPQNDYYEAMSLYALGNQADAMAILERAVRVAREFSVQFGLARVLGGIVVVTDDPDRRNQTLEEGERILDAGAVSHNHFHFALDAMDSCFDHGEWDRMEHYADQLEAYARDEPLPWSDFVVARARALAAWGRGERGPDTIACLRELRDQGREVSFISPLRRIDQALDE